MESLDKTVRNLRSKTGNLLTSDKIEKYHHENLILIGRQ